MEVTTVKQNPGIRFRVAGILMREGKILIQKGITDEEYALPKGHVEMFEKSEETLIREFKEEMNAEITVRKLLWIQERMGEWNNGKHHHICFYYQIDIADESEIPLHGVFHSSYGNDSEIEFSWVGIDKIKEMKFFPVYIKSRLNNLPYGIERFVEQEIYRQ